LTHSKDTKNSPQDLDQTYESLEEGRFSQKRLQDINYLLNKENRKQTNTNRAAEILDKLCLCKTILILFIYDSDDI
jgi:hypothetical protein